VEVNINTSITFENLLESTKRISHHIGGTRSGKTYAILQYLIVEGFKSKSNISVVRRTIPSLKRTVMKDFKDILLGLGIYDEGRFNQSDRIYTFDNGTTISFVNTDDPEKLRGFKSDVLFIDEASEVDEESYFQLAIRTTGKIIMAYNPTVSPYHWLRIQVSKEDVDVFNTTYRDNPYLPKEMVKAIEDLEFTNKKKWLIYGKGEFAPNERAIFQFDLVDSIGDADFVGFGIDFGFSADPTALVALYKTNDTLYLEELIYERGLVTKDIVDKLNRLDITKSEEIWADSAEPRLIEEIYRSGFNIKPVTKGKDSIKFGISVMQNYKIGILKSSQNLINEMYSYQYVTDKYGYVTDTPEGGLDHLIDAARYCCMMKLSQKAQAKGQYAFTIGNSRY
jgi:phage terminase large subunit